jgi:hypothetical protein
VVRTYRPGRVRKLFPGMEDARASSGRHSLGPPTSARSSRRSPLSQPQVREPSSSGCHDRSNEHRPRVWSSGSRRKGKAPGAVCKRAFPVTGRSPQAALRGDMRGMWPAARSALPRAKGGGMTDIATPPPDPGDGRQWCPGCQRWKYLVTHSCPMVPRGVSNLDFIAGLPDSPAAAGSQPDTAGESIKDGLHGTATEALPEGGVPQPGGGSADGPVDAAPNSANGTTGVPVWQASERDLASHQQSTLTDPLIIAIGVELAGQVWDPPLPKLPVGQWMEIVSLIARVVRDHDADQRWVAAERRSVQAADAGDRGECT